VNLWGNDFQRRILVLHRLTSDSGAVRGAVLIASGLVTVVVAAAAAFGLASPGTAAQTQYAPVNSVAPTISGTAQAGQTLTANNGTWTGDQPLVFSYQWLRCNSGGNNCVAIPNASAQTYVVADADVDATLRVQVAARNSQGSSTATSAQTARVTAAPGPAGAIRLPNGETSIPVTSVPATERLIIDRVDFTPNVVRSRAGAITVRVKVEDTRGFVVRDALVFLRSTPVVTSTPPETKTSQDGTITFTVQPEPDMLIRRGYSTQFFVRARKEGDRPLGGIAGYRLVQVASTG
jgi:hypothetical protein